MIGRLREAARIGCGLLTGGQERARARAKLEARRLSRQVAAGDVVVAMVEHMGDVVAVEPLIETLRRRHAGRRLVFVVSRRFADLVRHHPGIDTLLPVTCLGTWCYLKPALRSSTVYDLQTRGRWCSATGLLLERDNNGVSIDNYYSHGSLLHVACLNAGVEPIDASPTLHLPPVDVAMPGRPYVVLHTKSNQASRDWRDDAWRQLAATLLDEGLIVVEAGLQPTLADLPGVTSLCGKLDLAQTARVIGSAALFVGIDSGPAHLAHAMGTPGVILLGVYGPYARYMPYSGRYAGGTLATVVQHHAPVRELEVDVALAAVRERLARGHGHSPGGERGHPHLQPS